MHHSKPHHHFNHFLTSVASFHAFHNLFWAKITQNWKELQMNSKMDESWHGIIISPTKHALKSWEGYRKNWMHFVYKLDNLFRSNTVSDENSSITKWISFFKTYFNSRLFLHSICTIQSDIINFKPFSDFICYFSCMSWFILS